MRANPCRLYFNASTGFTASRPRRACGQKHPGPTRVNAIGDDFSPPHLCAPLHVVGTTSRPPKWIKPQVTRLVDEAPAGASWLHEIKYDGYRMHARIGDGEVKLLTRMGLDWSHRSVSSRR